MIKIEVTAADIAVGVPGDCFTCPVAVAIARATGGQEANVHDRYGELWIEVSGRSVPAPRSVWQFVSDFVNQPRDEDGRIVRSHEDDDPPGPFSFNLPDQPGPEWLEACDQCEELCAGTDLDDEGLCAECRQSDPLSD